MIDRYFGGQVPEPLAGEAASDLPATVRDAARRYDELVDELALSRALAAVWDVVDRANGYLVEKEPWALAGDQGNRAELSSVLYAAAEVLRVLAVLISPAMPRAAVRLWDQLGIEGPLAAERLPKAAEWGGLPSGTRIRRGEALFPRLED
jgi:methionyl-tRNA synthetase